jgi:D-Tyr-tRNAtyr deacylase
VAKERNNIYAVAADAVDLALDTAGTIGSMVGGIANVVGLGNSGKEKSDGPQQHQAAEQHQADDAANRVATSLHQEAEAVKPRSHKTHAANTHGGKTRSAKKATKPRKARKVAS